MVSVVLGVVVSGLAIPLAGVFGFAARSTADTMDDLPTELETDELPQKHHDPRRRRQRAGVGLRPEPRSTSPLDQISPDDGQGPGRDRGLPLLRARRPRRQGHRCARWSPTSAPAASSRAARRSPSSWSSRRSTTRPRTDEERAEVTDDTYARKLKELRYAIALEKKHSKDWILERYLNIVYFGDGAYGIQAAAKHYFDVNASKLNLHQARCLAGLVQNPTSFDPTNDPDRALERRDVVLDRMAELNVIPQERADKVKQSKLAST